MPLPQPIPDVHLPYEVFTPVAIGPSQYGNKLGILILSSGSMIFLHLLQRETVSRQNQVQAEDNLDEVSQETQNVVSSARNSVEVRRRRISLDCLLLPPLGASNSGRPLEVWEALEAAAARAPEEIVTYYSPGFNRRFHNLIIENLESTIPKGHANAIRVRLTLVEWVRYEEPGVTPGDAKRDVRQAGVRRPQAAQLLPTVVPTYPPLPGPRVWVRVGTKLYDISPRPLPKPTKAKQQRSEDPFFQPPSSEAEGVTVSLLLRNFFPPEPAGPFPSMKLEQPLPLEEIVPRGTPPSEEIQMLQHLSLARLLENLNREPPFTIHLPEGEVREEIPLLAERASVQALTHLREGKLAPPPKVSIESLSKLFQRPPSGTIYSELLNIRAESVPWQSWRQEIAGEEFEFELFYNHSPEGFPVLSMRWIVGKEKIPLIEGRKLLLDEDLLFPVRWHPVVRALAMRLIPRETERDEVQVESKIPERKLGKTIQVFWLARRSAATTAMLREAKQRVHEGRALPGLD